MGHGEPSGDAPTRILQYTYGGAQPSGIESYLIEAYREVDRSRFQFDFLFRYESPFVGHPFEREVLDAGGRISSLGIAEGDNVLRKQFKETRRLWRALRSGRYDYVEINMTSTFMCLQAAAIARVCGAKARIIHAHDAVKHENRLKRILKSPATPLVRQIATDRWACSEDAARYLFGNKPVEAGRWELVKNAIEADRFDFDEDARRQVRSDLGLTESFVVGMVGRFTAQKNHARALQIFAELLAKCPNARLVLVGGGELLEETVALAEGLGVTRSVDFLGSRSDLPSIYSAFDVLLAPSNHEGFPFVALEAQASGLPIVASDSFPAETNIIGNVTRLLLTDDDSKWARSLLATNAVQRVGGADAVKAAGYDRSMTGPRLNALYESVLARS